MIDMILASKFRPERLKLAVDNLFENCTNENTKLILVTDYDDFITTLAAFELINKYPGKITHLLLNFSAEGPVAALNFGTKLVTQKYLTYFADDCFINLKGWDDLAIKLLEENPEYMCLNTRAPQNNNILPFLDVEYAYTFVIDSEKFKKLGLFNPIYKRHYSDPDFFLHMIWNGELMMTSKDISFDHFNAPDELYQYNNVVSPSERDQDTFINRWSPRIDELKIRFDKIKDKWNKIV